MELILLVSRGQDAEHLQSLELLSMSSKLDKIVNSIIRQHKLTVFKSNE